jgi:hypothetical protein
VDSWYNNKIRVDNMDHGYSFISINYECKSMGLNKKGFAIALGIIAFIICIGAGSG